MSFTREQGISLVEVLVVVLIVSILASLLFRGTQSTQRAADTSAARSAASAYHDAVEAFRRDHGGRVPTWNSQEWPAERQVASGVRAAGVPYAWGPVNEGSRGRPYVLHIPERVADGRIALTGGGAGGAATNGARITYVRRSADSYDLAVEQRIGTRWSSVCAFGNGPTAGNHPC